MKERNVGIERYRCFCMFGIVFLHVATEITGSSSWERNIFKFCVDGFALISGFFGIRVFNLKKIANLYFVSALCVFLAELVLVRGHLFSMSLGRMYASIDKLWFLHAYVILMVLAPFINLAAESKEHVKVLLPFCGIIFIWGILCELPIIGKMMIHTNGIGSMSGLTLAAVYSVGKVYRLYDLSNNIKLKWVLVAVPLLVLINCLGVPHNRTGEWVSGWFGNYASPFCVFLAACVFYFFSRICIRGVGRKVIIFLSASMFPVYVIHQHPLFWDWLLSTSAKAKANGGGVMSIISISMMVFWGSVLFDIFRRTLVQGLHFLKIRLV